MRSMIPDYLSEAIADVAPDTSGAPVQYIPELAAADPDRLDAAGGEEMVAVTAPLQLTCTEVDVAALTQFKEQWFASL